MLLDPGDLLRRLFIGLVMSLASDDSRATPAAGRTDERPPRWSRMRSREGSEAGTPSESANGDLRMPVSGTRFESNMSRTQSEPSIAAIATSPQAAGGRIRTQSDAVRRSPSPQAAEHRPACAGKPAYAAAEEIASVASSLRSGRATSSCAARERAEAVEEAEMSQIINHIGHSCIDKYGSLQLAFHELKTDAKGDMRQVDLRRFFESHHVATRMADRFFQHMTKERRSSTMHVQELKSVFDQVVGQHLEKKSAKNVHGLLRPLKKSSFMEEVGCKAGDMASNAKHHDPICPERMKQITKAMTSREQRRYIDKSGDFRREDLQILFWNYGLKAAQANELFDRIDTNRNGEISFKEFNAHLPGFLGVKEEKEKHKKGANYNTLLDEERMTTICDHLGTKAGQKYRRVYDAFRYVDKDGDDKIDRWEVRNFFRSYGSKTKVADTFFDTLDTDREGKISYKDFQKRFAPYIQPGYHAPKPGENQREFYGGNEVKCYQSTSDLVNRNHKSMEPPTDTSNKRGRPRPNRSNQSPKSEYSGDSPASARSSRCQDELRANRFGKFDGISTYQASFNQHIFSGQDVCEGMPAHLCWGPL